MCSSRCFNHHAIQVLPFTIQRALIAARCANLISCVYPALLCCNHLLFVLNHFKRRLPGQVQRVALTVKLPSGALDHTCLISLAGFFLQACSVFCGWANRVVWIFWNRDWLNNRFSWSGDRGLLNGGRLGCGLFLPCCGLFVLRGQGRQAERRAASG